MPAQTKPPAFLTVFSDHRALAWVLTNARMAFGARNKITVRAIQPGSVLLLHATTRCFQGTPVPSTSGIIGKATVTSSVQPLDEPIKIGDLVLGQSCDISVDALARPEDAVNLGAFAGSLHTFAGMSGWRFKLMNPPILLDEHDFGILKTRLDDVARPPSEVTAYFNEGSRAASI
jgi:hypothetical protein